MLGLAPDLDAVIVQNSERVNAIYRGNVDQSCGVETVLLQVLADNMSTGRVPTENFIVKINAEPIVKTC